MKYQFIFLSILLMPIALWPSESKSEDKSLLSDAYFLFGEMAAVVNPKKPHPSEKSTQNELAGSILIGTSGKFENNYNYGFFVNFQYSEIKNSDFDTTDGMVYLKKHYYSFSFEVGPTFDMRTDYVKVIVGPHIGYTYSDVYYAFVSDYYDYGVELPQGRKEKGLSYGYMVRIGIKIPFLKGAFIDGLDFMYRYNRLYNSKYKDYTWYFGVSVNSS